MSVSRHKKLLLPVFFLSGFSALIYEVVWARMLSLVFGSTVEAVSAVVTAFMVGLALGSYVMGRLTDLKNSDALFIYSLIELSIGIVSLFFYFIIIALPDLHNLLHPNLTKFGLDFLFHGSYIFEFLLVAAPATLMGATFPLMIKSYVSSKNFIGEGTSLIYAVNTFGAVLGSFLTGFFLIPTFGTRMTIFIAVTVNVSMALTSYLIRRLHISSHKHDGQNIISITSEEMYSVDPVTRWSILVILTFSGFAAMSYQIAWTRVLTMVIGNSVYAFSAILTTFLAGIAMGSLLFVRQIDNVKDKQFLLGTVQGIIFLSVILSLPMMDSLPALFITLFRGLSGSFLGLVLIDFIVASSAILIPTILMGVTFPIAIRIYANRTDGLGNGVGRLYSANTVGCIFGAFLTGFYFIPSIGVQNTIIAISGINLAAAIILIMQSGAIRRQVKALAASASLALYLLSLLTMPAWNVRLLNLGVYFNADLFKNAELNRFSDESKLLYYEEGIGGTVAVTSANNHLSIQINGKTDGGTSTLDISPQILVSAIPLILHPAPKELAVIGLGSGTSLGAATLFPVDKIDCLEIMPEVVKANRYFSNFNHDALNDKRVNLIMDDSRRFLSYTDNKYDLIISEPSNPWISGVSNLFTLEFFKTAAQRLKEDGIMSQWVQLNSIDTKELKTLINTFRTVFPHVDVWASSNQDLVVMGSRKAIQMDPARAGNMIMLSGIQEELQKTGINNLEDFFGRYLMGDKELERFCKGASINTDDHPIIEFETPKALYMTTSNKNLSAILSSAAEINKQ